MPVEIGISHRSGQPFTATEVTTLTQTLGDGTKITRTAEDRIARDSEGRFYKEQHLPWTRDTRNPLYYVHIYDPSSKERIHLDPQKLNPQSSRTGTNERTNPFLIRVHSCDSWTIIPPSP